MHSHEHYTCIQLKVNSREWVPVTANREDYDLKTLSVNQPNVIIKDSEEEKQIEKFKIFQLVLNLYSTQLL